MVLTNSSLSVPVGKYKIVQVSTVELSIHMILILSIVIHSILPLSAAQIMTSNVKAVGGQASLRGIATNSIQLQQVSALFEGLSCL